MAEIDEFLKERREAGLLRCLRPVASRHNGKIIVEDKEYIDFSSNDYLGLSCHPGIIEAAKNAIDKFGASSSASRLLSGDLTLHHLLEEKIAQFKNKEAGLVFNSGYQGNLGIISTLFTKGDCIFSDRLNHASIIDGILLSGARFFRFQHNDIDHLKTLLKKERQKFKKAMVITETIFSMDGDKCLLKDIVGLKEKYNCEIMVDEAHATGIFGRNGSGMVEEQGLWTQEMEALQARLLSQ
jgi:7-keto-8-aminopelargonate synthetase-like enzyme